MDNEIVSFTTRKPREGEIDGIDYNFIAINKFKKLYDNDKLVEWSNYGGEYYGITKDELENKLKKDNAFVVVDVVGMKTLTKLYPNSVSVFIYSDEEQAYNLMKLRGDKMKDIEKRLITIKDELNNIKYYDCAFKNKYGQLNKSIKIMDSIIDIETNLNYNC